MFGGGVERIEPRLLEGTDDAVPSIYDVFDDESAPGLSRQPDFLRSFLRLDVDYREQKNARKGGWYRLTLSRHDDRDFNAYSFNQFDVDLQQFVSVLAERRVFAVRAFLTTSDPRDGHEMPFYLMPTLGGNDTLRGFRTYRFRGEHGLLLQGEYRWEIWSALSAALFYDAGKVTLSRSELNLRHLESDYGFGLRFNTNEGSILRIDAAFGSRDGRHVYIAWGGRF